MEEYFYNLLYKHENEHWWYWVRRKLVHKLIRLYRPSLNQLTILDIGCGTGKLSKELGQYGKVVSIDKSEQAIKFCRQNRLDAEQSSVENYKANKQFDIIVALDILEHCQDDKKTIEKINELLKDNGIAIIFVPALKMFWGRQDVVSHHFRRYSYNNFYHMFQNSGFTVLAQSYFNFFLAGPIFIARKIANLLNIKFDSELKYNNPFINSVCKFIFNIEIYLIPKIKLPFGVSLLGVYKKN